MAEGTAEDVLTVEEGLPDGAVVDAGGNLWVAVVGAGRVVCYGPDGTRRGAVEVPATQVTCPAFGGADLSWLLVTSAAVDMQAPTEADGCTFLVQTEATGQTEHRVLIE